VVRNFLDTSRHCFDLLYRSRVGMVYEAGSVAIDDCTHAGYLVWKLDLSIVTINTVLRLPSIHWHLPCFKHCLRLQTNP